MIRVLVVDDHELVRCAIARILEDANGIQVIGQAESGETAIDMVAEQRPNVVLMDINMPGIDGVEATRHIKQKFPQVKVIALTAMHDGPIPPRMIEAGALGYLTKDASINEAILAITKVNAGQVYLNQEVAQRLALKGFDKEINPFDKLSDRELQITMRIIRGDRVQEIADKLFLNPKTVNTHRYRVFEKLGIKNDVTLTLLAIKYGLVDPADDEIPI